MKASFAYYRGGNEIDGTGLRLELGTNIDNTEVLGTGEYKFGNFGGTAKPYLFDEVFESWEFKDASNYTIEDNINLHPSKIIGKQSISNKIEIQKGINNELNFTINNEEKNIIIDEGSYEPSELIENINEKLSDSDIALSASLNENDRLIFTKEENIEVNNIWGNASKDLLIEVEETTISNSYIESERLIDSKIEISENFNDSIDIKIDDTWININVEKGVYEPRQFINELNQKLTDKDIPAEFSINNQKLRITHKKKGSDHLIQDLSGNLTSDLFYKSETGNNPKIIETDKLNIHTGANSSEKVTISMPKISLSNLGLSNINLSSKENANKAISKIDKAIDKVSSEQSKIGANQNALAHTSENLSNYESNISRSLSHIKDADMAKEMMDLTKTQILQESGLSAIINLQNNEQRILEILNSLSE